ncbi:MULTISPECIES: P-loop NTPase fold protein [unclassified Pseudoalteromonas]|uniref:P-loop NTPase fold protein n=1 Tax=unclassified Pseudoalteromonas TaxID=194690 RepID=UPI00386B0C4D
MSQVKTFPITARRWLSLLLCAITAATITVFLSKAGFVQKAYSSLGAILNANPILHYSSAFLAGIGIKLLLDKFYISHPKRSIGFNWRYPPVTISVLFGLFFIVSYVYVSYSNEILAQLTAHAFVSFKFLSLSFLAAAATIIYQTKLYTKNPIFSVALCAVSAFYLFSAISLVETEQAFRGFLFIAAAYLAMSVFLLCDQLRASSAESKVESKQEAELTLESLENFRRWLKDDSTIKNTEQLEPDLQVYAKRITERLRTGGDKEGYEKRGAQHIALCGPFGCGKSSIVDSIANELTTPPKQNGVWIHSDISTWGAASGSVAHVILSNIIDDISQYIDMCAFRALPKHYTEALKSGGSVFQFASTLLAGPIDIEQSFQKLNDALEVTNHKLLITLQDVDRGTGDENEKRLNDIAALLDRLKDKNLSNINFIVAMGNEKPAFEDVISKATDYREDIAKSNFKDLLVDYIYENLTKSKVIAVIPYSWKKLDDIKNSSTKRTAFYLTEITELNKLIPSFRTLKKVLRRANEVWWKNNLKGEVNFISLLMVLALREVKPSLFSNYLNFVDSAKLNSELVDVEKFLEKDTPSDLKEYLKVMLNIKINIVEIKDSDPPKERDIWLLNPNKEYLQTVGCTNDMSYYIQRITRQSISNGEFIDQDVIKDILKLTKLPLSEFVEEWLSFDEYKQEKYSQFIFLRFNEDETLAYQESGNYNLSIKWSPEKCRHVIKFVHYLAKDLTLENMYMLFNQLFNAKDDYEKFNTLICYLGVEGFSGDLKTLKESQIGFLILKLLQISFNKLAPNTSSIPSERDKLATYLKLKDMTFSEDDGVRLLNADCLQLQYDYEKSRSQNK